MNNFNTENGRENASAIGNDLGSESETEIESGRGTETETGRGDGARRTRAERRR